jgi:anti-sigma factor RsiW
MSIPMDITCRELVELVSDWLDGRLPPAERTRFETHLCYCSACRRYVQQMRQVREAAGRLGEEDVPAEAREALLAAFRGWKTRRGGGTS